MKDCLTAGDFVLLNDLLQYEIAPTFEQWEGLLDAVVLEVVDITDTIETKLEAVSCYKSQFDDSRLERVAHYLRSIAGAEGAAAGFAYGELFALPRLLGTNDMVSALGAWNIPPPFQTTGQAENT